MNTTDFRTLTADEIELRWPGYSLLHATVTSLSVTVGKTRYEDHEHRLWQHGYRRRNASATATCYHGLS